MTTAYEVMTRLGQEAQAACYPNGTGSAGVTAHDIKVVTGWPVAQDLENSLVAGKSQVSVFTMPTERDTTRYNTDWREVTRPAPTVTAVAVGQVLTIGGTVAAGNMVAVLIDRGLYAYVVLLGDTLTSIAAALLALIQVDLPGATATGPAITVPATSQILSAQTGAPGTAVRNLRQTERQFQVTVWSPLPADRDAIATAIERWLATLTTDPERVVSFLTMPDGTMARIKYQRGNISDDMQKVRVYRHDLYYLVDYSLTATATFAPVLLSVLNLTVGLGPLTPVNGTTKAGVVNVGGTTAATLYVGPDQPMDTNPYYWVRTDKPISDPTFNVLYEGIGP